MYWSGGPQLATLFSALLDFAGISFAVSRDIGSDYFKVFRIGASLNLGLERSPSSYLEVFFSAPFLAGLVAGLGFVRSN